MSGSRVNGRVEGARVDHENTLPFLGRVLGKLRLCRKRDRGGGAGTRKTKIVDT